MDQIIVEDITCFAYHGVLPEENKLGQQFKVSLELNLDLSEHTEDNLAQVPDYRQAVEIVNKYMSGKPYRLLETLACMIAEELLETLPSIQKAVVKVCKPNPPLAGVEGGVTVKVSRSR